jgi:protein gp37
VGRTTEIGCASQPLTLRGSACPPDRWPRKTGRRTIFGKLRRRSDRLTGELRERECRREESPLAGLGCACNYSMFVQSFFMADSTQIEWTDSTWNPVTGCSKITEGCNFCYAERFSERFRGVDAHPFENGFDLTLRPARLAQPLLWKKPRRIFVNSMSDLFHKDVPTSFIDAVFDTMETANWHTYQILTKRSSLLAKFLRQRYGDHRAPSHMWFGVSVENKRNAVRLGHLKSAKASVKFVSFEPLIGSMGHIDLTGIDWAIVGGESGPRSRPMHEEWAVEVRDQCKRDGVAFFFKQWGGVRPKSGGRLLRGREWNEYPATNKLLAHASA